MRCICGTVQCRKWQFTGYWIIFSEPRVRLLVKLKTLLSATPLPVSDPGIKKVDSKSVTFSMGRVGASRKSPNDTP